MPPITYAILAGTSFGLWFIFHKQASAHIGNLYGAIIVSLVAVLFGLIIWGSRGFEIQQFEISTKGILFVALAGLMAFSIDFFSLEAFAKGVPVSLGAPIIVGLSILVPTVIGIFFLNEGLNPLKILALLLIGAGIVILTMMEAPAA